MKKATSSLVIFMKGQPRLSQVWCFVQGRRKVEYNNVNISTFLFSVYLQTMW